MRIIEETGRGQRSRVTRVAEGLYENLPNLQCKITQNTSLSERVFTGSHPGDKRTQSLIWTQEAAAVCPLLSIQAKYSVLTDEAARTTWL